MMQFFFAQIGKRRIYFYPNTDGDRKQIRVVKGKGAKDRYVTLPEELLEVLRGYWKAYRPQKYLFNGQYRGSQWQQRSAQHALKMLAHAQTGTKCRSHVFGKEPCFFKALLL